LSAAARCASRCWQALLVLGLLCAAGRTAAFLPAPYGGAISVALPDQIVTLDPARATRESELQVISLLFDPLYVVGPDNAPRPHLVEPGPEISPDGKVWRLRLRPNVRLTTGRALTASDVVTSLRRLKKGPNAYLLAPVRALEVDGSTVVVRLWRKTTGLPWLLAAPSTGIAIVPSCGAVFQPGGPRTQGCSGIAGSGPFRLHARTPTTLHLKAHVAHFAGRPYLDDLRLTVFDKASAEVATFQIGGLQVSLHGTSVFGGRPRHASAELESSIITPVFLGVGRSKPYLADPQFRLALLKGIDRRRLGRLAAIGRAEVADSPVCARLLRGAPRAVAFDRPAASRLLGKLAGQHATMRADSAGGRLKLSLLVDASRFEDPLVAGQIIADLDRLALAATIEARPAAEYQARLEDGRYELVLGRQPLQAALAPVAMAGALAGAGERQAAQRCLAAPGCGAKEAAQFMKRLPFIPLVHVSSRVFYDARLAAPRLTPLGLVGYADLFWTRRGP
jgi:peptide/nickel transport system substrate-binding protein